MRTGERALPLFSPGERLVLAIVAAITVAVQLWGWWQSYRAVRILQEESVRAAPDANDTGLMGDQKPAAGGDPTALPAETAVPEHVAPTLVRTGDVTPEPGATLSIPSQRPSLPPSSTGPSVASLPTGSPFDSVDPGVGQVEQVVSTSVPGLLSLNKASAVELEALPGIGPALAGRIVEYRDQHGPFRSVEELQNVPGIGEARFRELQSRVTVP